MSTNDPTPATPEARAAAAPIRRLHVLKTDPDVFRAVLDGTKRYEIRRDDRGFAVGDALYLHETMATGEAMKHGAPLEYTGRLIEATVLHLLRGPIYGLAEGWVIMSIETAAQTREVATLREERDRLVRENDTLRAGDPFNDRQVREMRAERDAAQQRVKELEDRATQLNKFIDWAFAEKRGAYEHDWRTATGQSFDASDELNDLRARAEKAEKDLAQEHERLLVAIELKLKVQSERDAALAELAKLRGEAQVFCTAFLALRRKLPPDEHATTEYHDAVDAQEILLRSLQPTGEEGAQKDQQKGGDATCAEEPTSILKTCQDTQAPASNAAPQESNPPAAAATPEAVRLLVEARTKIKETDALIAKDYSGSQWDDEDRDKRHLLLQKIDGFLAAPSATPEQVSGSKVKTLEPGALVRFAHGDDRGTGRIEYSTLRMDVLGYWIAVDEGERVWIPAEHVRQLPVTAPVQTHCKHPECACILLCAATNQPISHNGEVTTTQTQGEAERAGEAAGECASIAYGEYRVTGKNTAPKFFPVILNAILSATATLRDELSAAQAKLEEAVKTTTRDGEQIAELLISKLQIESALATERAAREAAVKALQGLIHWHGANYNELSDDRRKLMGDAYEEANRVLSPAPSTIHPEAPSSEGQR